MFRKSLGVALATWLLGASAHGQTWDRDAVYAQRVSELKKTVESNSKDVDALVAIGAFYLKPLGERTVAAADGKERAFFVPLRNEITPRIKDIYAVPWVFRGDTTAAWPYLKQAITLDPNHAGAARELAMYYRMRNDLDRMKPYMEQALRADPLDLDMCRLYLDHRTALARVLNDQAASLRAPRTHEEDRADGRYRVTTYPSEADLARAKQLDAQAQDARRDAIKPMMNLAKALRDDPTREATPAKQAKWRLATAIYFHWIGELEKAAGTAAAGLREDPTNLDCLDYVVDILRGTHTKDKHAQYKAILDRWGGVDSSPVFLEDKPRGPKR